MIYKVYYQENPEIAPRRENTKSLYAEADSIPDLKKKITDKFNYGIEYITKLNDEYLNYEKEHNPDFSVIKDL